MAFKTGWDTNSHLHPKERRWYFAYHSFHGMIYAVAWCEDDGICVGGRPKILKDTQVEITEEQFGQGLSELEAIFPIPLVMESSRVSTFFET